MSTSESFLSEIYFIDAFYCPPCRLGCATALYSSKVFYGKLFFSGSFSGFCSMDITAC